MEQRSDFQRNILTGISDGLIVPFALGAGLSAAVDSNQVVVFVVLAQIIAGSIFIGIAGFHANKGDPGYSKNTGHKDDEPGYSGESEETKIFYGKIGLPAELQEQAAKDAEQDHAKWTGFIQKFDLGLDHPDSKQALRSAWIIALSYAAGGFIPLIPYIIFADLRTSLQFSAFITMTFLLISGYFKSRLLEKNPWWGALRSAAIGAIAAVTAVGIARLF